MIYLQLFFSFLQIGAFSFGGGYAAMPLIQNQVVDLHPWLSQAEFTDLITISQMTPGPIAINSATFVGTRIAGPLGALAATLGCVLPSCILVTLLAKLYLRYRNLSILQEVLSSLRPGVIAMIAAAGASILITALWGNEGLTGTAALLENLRLRSVLIFAAALFLLKARNMNPILVMLLSGLMEVLFQIIFKILP